MQEVIREIRIISKGLTPIGTSDNYKLVSAFSPMPLSLPQGGWASLTLTLLGVIRGGLKGLALVDGHTANPSAMMVSVVRCWSRSGRRRLHAEPRLEKVRPRCPDR